MNTASFDILKEIIRSRRTTSVALMNGDHVPNEQVRQLLELADWAPTHGRTEPWRFVVYSGASLQEFAQAHADLYWQHTPEEARDDSKYKKLKEVAVKASHLVAVVMQRGSNPKIPVLEEVAAVSAAAQNLLLGATALGISAIWNTGGMTHHPAMRQLLGFGDNDLVLGLVFLGYTNAQPRPGHRNVPLSDKIVWR